MGNIVLLDDLTINKIAAGEVIERPASVIKEMVENSIDAGATSITVEIKNGGISFIKVTDNGKGIPEDDMEMAFERHATSKIRSADDLNTVTSMGFRGEALASIAAIAKVEMVSKTANQGNGYKVVVEGGKVLEKTEAGSPIGTSITVTNLFYNTPVRYKFLKKDYTESGYIEDVITRIALVHPEISIKLINTGKTIIQTNGNGDLKTVIYSIYGKDVAGGIIETDYTYEDMHIYGVIGKPEIARSNRAYQMFFVNKRYIKDKFLSSAAERAYKGMIPVGKFSFLVLNIDMNPSKVDVNVHPAKLEVRFEEENVVFKAVYHAIKDALLKSELVADTNHTTSEKRSESGLFGNRGNSHSTETIVEQIYKARQLNGIPSLHREISSNTSKMSNVGEVSKSSEASQLQNEVKNDTNMSFGSEIPSETKSSTINGGVKIPEIEKSQEVLRKLQEIKEKLIQESPELREKIEKEHKENLLSFQTNTNVNTNTATDIRTVIEEPKEKSVEEANLVDQKEVNYTEKAGQEELSSEKIVAEEEEVPYAIKEMRKEREEEEQQEAQNKQTVEIGQIQKEETKQQKLETNVGADTGFTKEFEEMYLKLFGTRPVREEKKEEKTSNDANADEIATLGNMSVFDNIEEYKKPTYKFIGIVFKTYIIIEIENEMYIIDQHAAHERILYEKVRQNYYNDENKDSQLMLLPDIITLTHKEMEIAKDNMQMFRKAGFMVEEFGENTIKLTGVPEMCLDLETKEMFLETLDEINSVSRTAKQEVEEKFLSTIACKAAVKANMALTKEEVDSLMDKLLSLPNPFTCPHGRPTAIKMSKYDIERKFARK